MSKSCLWATWVYAFRELLRSPLRFIGTMRCKHDFQRPDGIRQAPRCIFCGMPEWEPDEHHH